MKSLTKSHKTITLASLIVLSGLSQSVFAGTNSPAIDHRQDKQKHRIGQGIHSGELKPGEVIRLGAQQARIRHQEHRFKADGNFTKRERIKVHQSQNRASKNIYSKKHNNRN